MFAFFLKKRKKQQQYYQQLLLLLATNYYILLLLTTTTYASYNHCYQLLLATTTSYVATTTATSYQRRYHYVTTYASLLPSVAAYASQGGARDAPQALESAQAEGADAYSGAGFRNLFPFFFVGILVLFVGIVTKTKLQAPFLFFL